MFTWRVLRERWRHLPQNPHKFEFLGQVSGIVHIERICPHDLLQGLKSCAETCVFLCDNLKSEQVEWYLLFEELNLHRDSNITDVFISTISINHTPLPVKSSSLYRDSACFKKSTEKESSQMSPIATESLNFTYVPWRALQLYLQ